MPTDEEMAHATKVVQDAQNILDGNAELNSAKP
jgi:hypothetical protein